MGSKLKGRTPDDIIKKLSSDRKLVVNKLRNIVKKIIPNVEETVKWGNITYILNGQNLCWILFYKNHTDFGFFHGAKLNSNLLEGTGKSMRHIKIRSKKDINEKEIISLLKQAKKLTHN